MSPADLLAHPLSQAATQTLTLVLLHFVWQGLLVAAGLVAIVELVGIRRPQRRYLCSLSALLLMMACPLATWAWLGVTEGTGNRGQETVAASAVLNHSPLTTHYSPTNALFAAAQPYVLTAWLAGVAFFGGRLLLGMVGVRQLRTSRLPMPRELSDRVEQIGRRLAMRARSMVFLSRRVSEAMAVGLIKPIVLIPAAWATEMPLAMLEAVIAHELAHLQRRDLWVNLLQRVVETLLFYHPAVWWLSRRLRTERELCCDELAVAVTGRRLVYVQALESVARRGTRVESLLAVGIRGERNMQLLGRVRHVLGLSAAGDRSRLWPAGLVALLLPLAAWGWSAGVIAPQSAAAVADDDDDDDDEKERGKEGREKEDDDDDDKPAAKKILKDREDGDDEKEVRKEAVEKEVRKDGEQPGKEGVRKDVRKEPIKDVDYRKVFRKDGDDEPKTIRKEGEKREVRIEIKDGDGDGQVAELAAMVKKLMAENAELRAALAAARGEKKPAAKDDADYFRKKDPDAGEKEDAAKEKEAANYKEKEAFFKRAIKEKEAAAREKEEAAREKEGAAREKEATGRDEARRAIAEKIEILIEKGYAEEAAALREQLRAKEGARKEILIRERKSKEGEEAKALDKESLIRRERELIEKKKAEAKEREEKEEKDKDDDKQ